MHSLLLLLLRGVCVCVCVCMCMCATTATASPNHVYLYHQTEVFRDDWVGDSQAIFVDYSMEIMRMAIEEINNNQFIPNTTMHLIIEDDRDTISVVERITFNTLNAFRDSNGRASRGYLGPLIGMTSFSNPEVTVVQAAIAKSQDMALVSSSVFAVKPTEPNNSLFRLVRAVR